MVQQGKEGTFDFAFVDANKDEYMKYHELLIKLVRIGGIIAFDNTLWCGTVALDCEDQVDMDFKEDRKHIMELNRFLATDCRMESCLVSTGDGLTLCRRLY